MNNKLDLKDKKLLYELDLNSRQSFQELGRKIGLSKNSVKYRIENLKKEGIIKNFHTVVDSGKLGFISFRLYLSLQNTTPEKEEEILEFLIKKEIVTWVVSIDGEYNIGSLILTKSVKEMNELWKELTQKYVNFINKKLLTIMTNVSYYSRAYLLGLKNNVYEISFITEPDSSRVKLDKTDFKILQIMAPNARISITEIALKLNFSVKTIMTRIKNLEEKGVIIGHKTVFDLEKLGYLYYKINFKLHNVSLGGKRKFESYIRGHQNIIYNNEVLGGNDLEIELQVKDSIELRNIIEEIKHRFGEMISDYETMLFYKEHKYLFLPIVLE